MLFARTAVAAAVASVRTSSSRRARSKASRRVVSTTRTVAAASASASAGDANDDARDGDDSWLTDMIADAIAEEAREARRADDGTLREAAAAAAAAAHHGDDDDAHDDDAQEEDDDIDAYASPYAHGDVDARVEGEFMGASTASAPVAGDAAVILIGFRPEEWPRVRVLVDELGGYDVPVIPARAEHAFATLEAVTAEREPDWESPRGVGDAVSRGGGFGAQRAVAFSGLDLGEVAVLVSAMESQGLPRLAVIIANEDNLRKPLGEALASALKNARRDARRRRASTGASARAASNAPPTSSPSPSPSPGIEQVIPELVPAPTRLTDASRERAAADGAPPIEAHSALHDVEQRAAAAESQHAHDDDDDDDDGAKTGGFMTKRELKSLAERRGVSYEDLLARARAAGASLPD